MSTLSPQWLQSTVSPRNLPQTTSQSAGFMREQSVNFREEASTDITITTNDGDKVTLNTSDFVAMDSYSYNAQGMVESENGTAFFLKNEEAITLASGKSFSFTLQGDLDEEEIADIKALLGDLDAVMEEMKQGDMDDAVEKVMDMGGYDSVKSYAADLNHAVSYTSTTTEAALAKATQSATGDSQRTTPAEDTDGAPPWVNGQGKKLGHANKYDNLLNNLLKHIDRADEKTVGFAKGPIEKLFGHHIDEMDEEQDDLDVSIRNILEKAMMDIRELITERMDTTFGEQLESVETEQAVESDDDGATADE